MQAGVVQAARAYIVRTDKQACVQAARQRWNGAACGGAGQRVSRQMVWILIEAEAAEED